MVSCDCLGYTRSFFFNHSLTGWSNNFIEPYATITEITIQDRPICQDSANVRLLFVTHAEWTWIIGNSFHPLISSPFPTGNMVNPIIINNFLNRNIMYISPTHSRWILKIEQYRTDCHTNDKVIDVFALLTSLTGNESDRQDVPHLTLRLQTPWPRDWIQALRLRENIAEYHIYKKHTTGIHLNKKQSLAQHNSDWARDCLIKEFCAPPIKTTAHNVNYQSSWANLPSEPSTSLILCS